MTIFIPVLLICFNGSCEFMQAHAYYRTIEQCTVIVEAQKQHMREVAKQADQGKIDVLEGTCVEANVQVTRGHTT